jgi:hypothetical protein
MGDKSPQKQRNNKLGKDCPEDRRIPKIRIQPQTESSAHNLARISSPLYVAYFLCDFSLGRAVISPREGTVGKGDWGT